jgi:hypothetical protein
MAIRMSSEQPSPLPRLELPRRWEFLEQRAAVAKVDPAEVVERVDDAANRVDELLRRVRDGGGGVIEVFYGLSGSGKTTFLRTLSRFFDNIRVNTFSNVRPLSELPAFILSDVIPGETRNRVVLIDRRDNPTVADLAQVEEAFGNLLNAFREPGGAAVVLWPITKVESAEKVAQTAWVVGRDSMADEGSRGQYHFKGVPKAKYWDLADNTSRSLTGDSLEAYGLTKEILTEILPSCDTISDFFGRVTDRANAERDRTWSVLKVRSTPHLWVALPGDDLKLLNATADALTQGIQSKVDIDKIGELIDQADDSIIYVAEWKGRRGKLAHLLRTIDTRLFGIPPNVSVAAIRTFGDASLKAKLRQPGGNLEAAKTAMKASRLYKAILREANVEADPFAGSRRIGQETIDDFIRIQTVASKDDKPLNKALASLIAACLADDAPHLSVVSEKRSVPGSGLQPDIQIELRAGEYICIEPTWRTSGKGLDGEIKEAQNTLSEAHLKKYMLEKATQYVKGFGL